MATTTLKLADLLSDFNGVAWREADVLTIHVWVADSGCYYAIEGRNDSGADLWVAPGLEFDERSADDFVDDLLISDPLPGSAVTSNPTAATHWGANQIAGGLGACTEIVITGGPWPAR